VRGVKAAGRRSSIESRLPGGPGLKVFAAHDIAVVSRARRRGRDGRVTIAGIGPKEQGRVAGLEERAVPWGQHETLQCKKSQYSVGNLFRRRQADVKRRRYVIFVTLRRAPSACRIDTG
jgi:hypothetical protein